MLTISASAEYLFRCSRLLTQAGPPGEQYSKLPPDSPKRMSSPAEQKRTIDRLLKSPPFASEWINRHIVPGLFKMENSPKFSKLFPQIFTIAKAMDTKKIDLFRNAVLMLQPEDVAGDYSTIKMYVNGATKLLTMFAETMHLMPSGGPAELKGWMDRMVQISESFSTLVLQGIAEVNSLKSK